MLIADFRANVRVGLAAVVFVELEAIRLEPCGYTRELENLAFLGHAQRAETIEDGEPLFLNKVVDSGVKLLPDLGCRGIGGLVIENGTQSSRCFSSRFIQVSEGIDLEGVAGVLDAEMSELACHFTAGRIKVAAE